MSNATFFGPPPTGRTLSQLDPTEDQIFDLLWSWFEQIFPPAFMPAVFRGHQNLTAAPSLLTSAAGSSDYVVVSPGIVTRTDQIRHVYVPAGPDDGAVDIQRGSVYAYQVDCYGPGGADRANGISLTWRSGWSADWFATADARAAPLYADEPQQLNFANAEAQFEQRFTTRLYAYVLQTLRAPQDFATGTVPIEIKTPADLLPP